MGLLSVLAKLSTNGYTSITLLIKTCVCAFVLPCVPPLSAAVKYPVLSVPLVLLVCRHLQGNVHRTRRESANVVADLRW